MIKNRYIIFAGIFAACVCLTLSALALLPPCPGVTKANFSRIKKGMTVAQVEKVFGRPADNKHMIDWVWLEAGEGATAISFSDDADPIVLDMAWVDDEEPGTLLQKLRRWFHLL